MNKNNRQSAGKLSLIWLSGFIDGEGCIRLDDRPPKTGKKWYCPEISISNTDLKTMNVISYILKENNVGHHLQAQSLKRTRKYHHKDQYRIMISGLKRCKKIIDIIIPYLITKKEQAEVLKLFIDYRLKVICNTPYGEKERNWEMTLKQLKR